MVDLDKKAILKFSPNCNNHCLFCHNRDKIGKGNFEIKRLFKKIDMAKDLGISSILFSGGEPTINKNFFEISNYAKKKGLSIGLITNGRMFSNKNFNNKMKEFNLSYVLISLHGPNEEIHDAITRTKGSFRQTLVGLKNVLEYSKYSIINVVITKQNLEHINEIIELLVSMDVKNIKLSLIEPLYGEDFEFIPPMTDFVQKVKSAIDFSNEKFPGLNVGWDGSPLCFMAGYEEKLIDLEKENIRYICEFWENEFHKVDEGNKIKLNRCGYCAKKDECGGLYKKYYLKDLGVNRMLNPYGDEQVDNELIKDFEKESEIRLVLLAARACCLNCAYCFVKKTNELMKESTLKKSIDFLISSDKKNLQLQFFGGEPLMQPYDVFTRSIEYAIFKAKESGKKIKIIITTNSVYLDDKRIEFLEKYKDNIIIEVSLDGDKISQNINRPQKNNAEFDSYSIITKNFPRLLKSTLNYRISMVVSPATCRNLLHNFEHLLDWGFKKIWMMLSCGVLWEEEDVNAFREQLNLIELKYYKKIKSGEILILNLRDWFAPYRMNTELIVDLNEKIYPACMNYLMDVDEIKEEFCFADLNNLMGKNIDYYEKLRLSNNHAINLFFKENKIIPNYSSNIHTGLMINDFVRGLLDKLEKDGVSVEKLFREV